MLLPWIADEDTQGQQSCVVVAERSLLRKIHEFWKMRGRTTSIPRGSSVELSYQEALRVKGSDQLRYLPETVIRAHELVAISGHTASKNVLANSKLGKAMNLTALIRRRKTHGIEENGLFAMLISMINTSIPT